VVFALKHLILRTLKTARSTSLHYFRLPNLEPELSQKCFWYLNKKRSKGVEKIRRVGLSGLQLTDDAF